MGLITRAAVLYETGKPLVIEELAVPSPLKGQVVVKIHYSGVCMSQVMEASGRRGEDKWLPHLMGHEASATVMETGPGVSKVAPGDKVVLTWIRSKGLDAPGCVFTKGNVKINSGGVTTFSDYSVVSENKCVKLPEGVGDDVACLLGCAVLTGSGILINEVGPTPGSTVAFFGLGGVGMSALMASGLYELKEVIAVDVDPHKLVLARDFGAKHVVNASEADPVEAIRELTNGEGVDYCVEAAGRAGTIEQAFMAVRKGGGLCVFASHPGHGEKICLDPHHLISGRNIRGSWGGASDPDRDIPKFADLYAEGRLPLEKLFAGRYGLMQINEALKDLESGTAGRPIIEIAPSD
jgi:S-(hydroxymethyl)glutathione dehydrogenase/alcohol dehydrogenase